MSASSYFVTRLLSQAPTLLLYLLASVFALVSLRPRNAAAGWLVFSGGLLSLLLMVIWASFLDWALRNGRTDDLQAIGVGVSFINAIGLGLMVAGAFVGRSAPPLSAGFEVQPAAGPPPLPRSPQR